ncbi:MAG: tRNA (guanine(37)-N(1))-methyltransferase [bacterium]|nr:tRNA (guanine(37)-N(1))-methyltransferase [bacterium]
MIFHVITTFPEFIATVFEYGVVRRGVEAGLLTANIVNLRDFTDDKHKSTDDMPYGGGPGMVMQADPIFRAVESIRAEHGDVPLLYLTPAGEKFSHRIALELAGRRKQLARLDSEHSLGTDLVPASDGEVTDIAAPNTAGDTLPPYVDSVPQSHWRDGFILLCGRYEGVDQRVIDHLVDRELSVGDYVLSGGELAAMVVVDAVARLVPGVLGNFESSGSDSFATGLLDWPHYTRPEVFRDWAVPPVLISGDHGKILRYRQEQALLLTFLRRPELLSDEQKAEVARLLAARQHQD